MSANPLRIAILQPDLRGGGAERVNLDLAYELQRRGHNVEFVLLCAEGEFLSEALMAFPVFDMGILRLRNLPVPFARYLRKRRLDGLIVGMWPLTTLAIMGRMLSGWQGRLVLSEHCALSNQYRGWGLFHWLKLRSSMIVGCRLADACVGVSAGVAKDIAKLALMPVERFHVIYNPIPIRPDPSRAMLVQADAAWGVPMGARILNVGSFKKQKNHPLLLQAFAQLPKELDARLMLLGKGEDGVALRDLASRLGIAERVLFAGFHADPTSFYKTADLFVLSSDYEGFGNVIVEALAAGTPVVSTDCPSGPREILENGRYGKLVPVGDADTLARAIKSALAEPVDREALKARASFFSPERAADEYLKLLLDD